MYSSLQILALCTTDMSSPPPHEDITDPNAPLDIIVQVQLSVKTTVKTAPTSKNKKGTSKTTTSAKKKEKTIQAVTSCVSDYVKFLVACLAVHGHTKYNVTASKVYPFKYFCGTART